MERRSFGLIVYGDTTGRSLVETMVICALLCNSEKMMRGVPKSGKVGEQQHATQDVFEFWSSPDFQVTMYVGIELPT